MRRRTTTRQLYDAITNNLLQIQKAQIHNKNIRKTEEIDGATFKENFDFLSESGAFVDFIGWHYELDSQSGECVADSGAMNAESDVSIEVFLVAMDGIDKQNINKKLLYVEE